MDYRFEKITADVPGSEGPIFDRLGRFFMVAPPKGQVLQVDLKSGEQRVHAETGGIPAGLQVDQANWLWLADMKRGILKISPDGEIVPVVETFEGEPIRGCNDCAFDDAGNLYFTAPAGSSAKNPVGEAFCRTAAGEVVRIDDGFAFCNGIAVSADNKRLIVAETQTKALWCYTISAPGRVTDKHLFARLPGEAAGGADGMDYDAQGHLLVAHFGGSSIDVFDPQGGLVERIGTPFAKPTNVHFGGEDGQDLYVTEMSTNSLWRTRWRWPGLRLIP